MAWLRNYNGLYNVLMSFPHWLHDMDETWLIVTPLNAEQIYSLLSPHIQSDCKLLISRFSRECFGQLSQQAWNWINAQKQLSL